MGVLPILCIAGFKRGEFVLDRIYIYIYIYLLNIYIYIYIIFIYINIFCNRKFSKVLGVFQIKVFASKQWTLNRE